VQCTKKNSDIEEFEGFYIVLPVYKKWDLILKIWWFQNGTKKRCSHYFLIHKEYILSNQRGSQVLREILQSSKEKFPCEVSIQIDNKIDPTNIHHLICYMYWGTVNVAIDEMVPLLTLSLRLKMNGEIDSELMKMIQSYIRY